VKGESVVLGYDTTSLGDQFLTLHRNTVLSFSRAYKSKPSRLIKMKALEISETNQQVMPYHILERCSSHLYFITLSVVHEK
jgi:hypothetical protein